MAFLAIFFGLLAALPLLVRLITGSAGVDEQTLPREAQLEAEGVCVRVAWLMVRSERRAIT